MAEKEKPLSDAISPVKQKESTKKDNKSAPKMSKGFKVVVSIFLVLIIYIVGYLIYEFNFSEYERDIREMQTSAPVINKGKENIEIEDNKSDEETSVNTDVEEKETEEEEYVLITYENIVTLTSGNLLRIRKSVYEDPYPMHGFAYNPPGGGTEVFQGYKYFKDIESMRNYYIKKNKEYNPTLVIKYPETVEVDGIKYQYWFTIDGYTADAAGIGMVYQSDPKVQIFDYEATRIRHYYNSPVEESLAFEGYYPEGHKWAGEAYTSGAYTGDGSEVVFCVFDISKIFKGESGFLVFDMGDLVNSPYDNCETIKEFEDFELSII
jgi:flagellar basal body-associated protein FliL